MSHPTRHAGRPRGPRYLHLTVEFLDSGELRISTPQARGAAAVVRGPDRLWHGVDYLRTEAAIAAYARWRGVNSDLDELTDPTDPTEPRRLRPCTPRENAGDDSEVSYGIRGVVRPDQHHPGGYTPNPDGSWTSPGGRRISHPEKIRALIIRRGKMNLSTSYDEWLADGGEAS